MSDTVVQEVEQLTAALLEGMLDEAGMGRLSLLVTENVEARRTYTRWMHQEADLHQIGAAMTTPMPGQVPGTEKIVPNVLPVMDRNLVERRRNRRIRFSVIAATSLVAMTLGFFVWSERREPSRAAASLVREVDAEWVTGETVIRVNGDFPRDHVELRQGLAELVFRSGVRVVVEAPASLEVIDPMRLRLDRGRVVVTAPPGVYDFVVQTPGGQVVDLGTEFGVHVDLDKRSSVHVFDGKVRVETSRAKMKLNKDDRLRFTAGGEQQDSPSAAKSFLRSLTPPEMTPELLLADNFDELSGKVVGQASGFSASPNHRWAESWRLFNRGSNAKWEVVSGNDPHLRVRGKTRARFDLVRRFVVDVNPGQTLYFSIAIRLHQLDSKRSQASLNFNDAEINIGAQEGAFRMRLGEGNKLTFGKTEMGRWYRLVGRAEFNVAGSDDRLSMWVDPEDASSPPAALLDNWEVGDDLGEELSFRCRRAEFDIRDVRVGTTFKSVLE